MTFFYKIAGTLKTWSNQMIRFLLTYCHKLGFKRGKYLGTYPFVEHLLWYHPSVTWELWLSFFPILDFCHFHPLTSSDSKYWFGYLLFLRFLVEISHQLYDCGASAIVTLPEFVGKVRDAEELIRTKHNVDYKLDIIVINYNPAVSFPGGVSDFKEMISSQADHSELKPNNRSIDDIVILPYSSGTTGLSKGVELTHRNCLSNCLQIDYPDFHHILPTKGIITFHTDRRPISLFSSFLLKTIFIFFSLRI